MALGCETCGHNGLWVAAAEASEAECVAELREQALAGKWQLVAEQAASLARKEAAPARLLAAYRILALMKLRRYSQAGDELCALGDLSTVPSTPVVGADGEQGGSQLCEWPFALRLLNAELPAALGKPSLTLDLLYKLFSECRTQHTFWKAAMAHGRLPPWLAPRSSKSMDASSTSSQAKDLMQHPCGHARGEDRGCNPCAGQAGICSTCHGPAGDDVQGKIGRNVPAEGARAFLQRLQETWHRRSAMVACSLASRHLSNGQPLAALALLNKLLTECPSDPWLWVAASCVQLQLGDVQAARDTLLRAQALAQQVPHGSVAMPGSPTGQLVLWLGMQSGCIKVATKDMEGAAEEFEAALASAARNPSCAPCAALAASNRSVAHLHAGELSDAVVLLQDRLRAEPKVYLHEGLLFTLGRMIDLSCSGSVRDMRYALQAWAAPLCPDDFDLSCIEALTNP